MNNEMNQNIDGFLRSDDYINSIEVKMLRKRVTTIKKEILASMIEHDLNVIAFNNNTFIVKTSSKRSVNLKDEFLLSHLYYSNDIDKSDYNKFLNSLNNNIKKKTTTRLSISKKNHVADDISKLEPLRIIVNEFHMLMNKLNNLNETLNKCKNIRKEAKEYLINKLHSTGKNCVFYNNRYLSLRVKYKKQKLTVEDLFQYAIAYFQLQSNEKRDFATFVKESVHKVSLSNPANLYYDLKIIQQP